VNFRAISLAFLVLAGCSDPEQELRSAKSWSATAQRVGQFWVAGEVPAPYARLALKKAADELRKGPLPAAAAPVEELIEALDRGDRPAAKRVLEEVGPR
jgi:hypothetical protein